MTLSTLVVVLRAVSLLAFAGPMLLRLDGSRGETKTQARRGGGSRAPVVANFAASASLFASLVISSGSSEAPRALPMALSGSVAAVAGAILVLRSRVELGHAWSLVPRAGQDTGLVTTGPYRLVRHPIYLGLALHALGVALAFDNWLALSIVLCGIVPTLVWRARAEEELLSRTFGGRYARYRQQTRGMVRPRRRSGGLEHDP